MKHFGSGFCALAAAALVAGCVESSGPQFVNADPQSTEVVCYPHSLTDNRMTDVGFDLCTDGKVFNWDGLHRGYVVAQDGNTVTIQWNDAIEGLHDETGVYRITRLNSRW